MKDTARLSLLGIALAAIMTGASLYPFSAPLTPVTLTTEELSWIEFCKARGYDLHDTSDDRIDEYLDTWVGSVEEERAFNNLPAIEPV